MAKRLAPIHPGEILLEAFMRPAGASQNALARALGVDVARIADVVHGRRAIGADTAMRLAVWWRTTPEFWMNLQVRCDLEMAATALGARGLAAICPRPAMGEETPVAAQAGRPFRRRPRRALSAAIGHPPRSR